MFNFIPNRIKLGHGHGFDIFPFGNDRIFYPFKAVDKLIGSAAECHLGLNVELAAKRSDRQ